MIDVVAVVDVGALIGEPGLDGRVDELLERPAPEDLGRRFEREAEIVSLFMRRSSRLIARYEARKLLGIVDLELGASSARSAARRERGSGRRD